MANKKFKNKSTIDRNISRKDPLADYKASERRKKKIKDMGSFNKGGDSFLKRRMKLGGADAIKKGLGMTLGRTAQGAGIALIGGSIASMIAKKIKKMKKKKNAMKNMKDVSKYNLPKKKMGGGMMQQPMGYDKGGMCRGMGAAIRGGKFEGVK